jgi:hypothetical protein
MATPVLQRHNVPSPNNATLSATDALAVTMAFNSVEEQLFDLSMRVRDALPPEDAERIEDAVEARKALRALSGSLPTCRVVSAANPYMDPALLASCLAARNTQLVPIPLAF